MSFTVGTRLFGRGFRKRAVRARATNLEPEAAGALRDHLTAVMFLHAPGFLDGWRAEDPRGFARFFEHRPRLARLLDEERSVIATCALAPRFTDSTPQGGKQCPSS